MAIHALVYCSQVAPWVTVEQLEDLVRDAATHNSIAGVTGVLLCDGTRFLQYVEGPEDGVALAFARILNATSHFDVEELGRRQGALRKFPYWSMHWIPIEQVDLWIAISSEWRNLNTRREDSMFLPPTGIERIATLVRPYVREWN
ncbi:MAG: BLUF domain-containing protein [Stenotrophomonas sp.]|uniref:BLUF domain-containing protein n=1 Tax=Gammaproteobacteria TaxID=1236 RepID=UPI003D6D9150